MSASPFAFSWYADVRWLSKRRSRASDRDPALVRIGLHRPLDRWHIPPSRQKSTYRDGRAFRWTLMKSGRVTMLAAAGLPMAPATPRAGVSGPGSAGRGQPAGRADIVMKSRAQDDWKNVAGP